MNLLLLQSEQINNGVATVSGRQLQQLQEVHGCVVGDSVRVGELNGLMGTGIVSELNAQYALLQLHLDCPPPAPIPLTLLLAMPRPKMLRRTLQSVASMGVKQIYLINSFRVEKSFWQSPFLNPNAIQEQLILGLEQARDTQLPELHIRTRFKPFVEDELAEIINGSHALLAHPVTDMPCPVDLSQPATLAIGPEGGFIPYEIEKLCDVGFRAVHVGPRILRVETAVPALLSRLFPSR
jgi:16S rRNA (uracil1498-N3)-methyltransferase